MFRGRLLPTSAPESTILVVLLLTLGVTGALAYQTQAAQRSHRQSVEAALRDYAAFANWGLGRHLEQTLDASLNVAVFQGRLAAEIAQLSRMAEGHDARNLARFRAEFLNGLDRCGCVNAVHDVFVLDLGTRAVESERPLSPGFEDWLRRVIAVEAGADTLHAVRMGGPEELVGHAPRVRRVTPSAPATERSIRSSGAVADPSRPSLSVRMTAGPPYALRVHPLESSTDARLVYTILHDRQGAPQRVYGFVLNTGAFAGPTARMVADTAELLPPSLTRGRTNDEVLALRISTASGEELYHSPGSVWGPTHVVDTVTTAAGQLVTEVAIRPDAAASLVIGGIPAARFPLLLSAFLLTFGLVVVAAVQLRRHHALVRIRNDFVSGVSHELRTPLAQISLFGQLLELGRLQPDQRNRSIRIINEETQRLTYLVDNILQFSRTGRTDQQISPTRTDAGALARSIVEGFTPLARTRAVTLALEIEEDLVAPVDENAIRQILLNLLDNAVKYGPSGQRVQVGVSRHGSFLRLSVEDEGPGIPSAERLRVWEPYQRLDRDRESASGGSGIGLSVVRELVKLHGGSATIEDGVFGGARFVILLPGCANASRPAHSGTEGPPTQSAG